MDEEEGMISVEQELPKEGETIKAKINFWHFGAIHHTETIETTYLGDSFTGRPMVDVDTGDMAYPELVSWKRISNG